MRKKMLFFGLSIILLWFTTMTSIAYSSGFLTTPSGIPISELEQFIDDYVAEYIGTSIAGTQIIVMKNGETLLSRVYGYTDIENGVLVDFETVFDWASVTKLLVWTSVFQLAEQGVLDLNTDISEYLPEGFFKHLRFNKPITMLNLMHHNAGWGVRTTDSMTRSSDNILNLEEALRRFEPNQMFEPGTVVGYSNYGATVAGYVVECISGLPFYEYVNKNIFSVLGMNDTAIHPTQADNPSISGRRDRVKDYMIVNDVLTLSPFNRVFFSDYPCGSTIGTAADMAKFLSALTPPEDETSLLFSNESTLKEMLSSSYSYGDGVPGMAHGFFEEFFAARYLTHIGSLPASSSRFTFSPESGFGLIVVTNTANHDFGSGIAKKLFGEFVPDVYFGTLPDIRSLSNLEGQYRGVVIENRGFMQLLVAMPSSEDVLSVVDENTISFVGKEFVQTSPFIFRNDSASLSLRLVVENNDVSRVLLISDTAAVMTAGAVMEYTPVQGLSVFASYLSVILFALGIIYFIVAIFIIIIGARRNKKKGIHSNFVKKLNMALILFGVFVGLNYLIMLIRAGLLAPHSALMLHFIFNVVYMVFAPVCSFLILTKMNRTELSMGRKIFYLLSSIISCILVALMILWEFYR